MQKTLSSSRIDRLFIELGRNSLTTTLIDAGKISRSLTCSNALGLIEGLEESKVISSLLERNLNELQPRTPLKATILLQRAMVSMRLVLMPQLDETYLAGAVSLEMESSLGDEVSQLEWDFISLGRVDDSSLGVLIVSARKSLLLNLRIACQLNRIEPELVTFAEIGYSRFCHDEVELVHLLVLHTNRIDAVIGFRGVIIQTQSVSVERSSECNASRLHGLLRRLHSSLPEALQQLPPTMKLVVVREGNEVQTQLRSSFEETLVEACKGCGFVIEEVSREDLYSDAIAKKPRSLRRQVRGHIDLAHPQQPSPPGFNARANIAIIVAVLFILAIGFWCFQRYKAIQLLEANRAIRQKIASIDARIAELEGQFLAANRLEEWDASSVTWSDAVRKISESVAERQDVYVVRLQMENQNYQQRAPLIRIEGRAKTTGSILQLHRDLGKDNPSWSVQPNGIEPSSVDPEYASLFRLEISDAKTLDTLELEVGESK